ncbi:hypothetical protein [Mesonia sp.]|uniref:hypothetical protein n=1 Tax=Mesonia sp. TaxID=1960830 RepID=UPI00176549BD|nr:hypothetical protein [Mesonia sp.]HIB37588.1 hypothetical protein [Mesonia sp.]HIO27532.1 hypothetical protein [Flavobacteriaceae bacterium]
MKIEIHLSIDKLIAVDELLQKVYELPVSLDKRENVYKSIGYDLADTFNKKVKTQIKKANLFDEKRKKITLKYHEAWALEEILKDLLEIYPPTNDYKKILLRSITDKLNQKLA